MTPTQARELIARLIEKHKNLDDSFRKSTTEAAVVHQFVTPLLEALGWPVHDPVRSKYELHTESGRPDMTLLPEQGGSIFVEAKRFGVIQELAQARMKLEGVVTPGQMALPGMAGDRTREEQQAINYAFQNGGTWAILTNFERLRFFNARRESCRGRRSSPALRRLSPACGSRSWVRHGNLRPASPNRPGANACATRSTRWWRISTG